MDAKERTRISSIAVIAIAAAGMVSEEKKQARKRKKRVAWGKPWLLKRQKHGAFEALLNGFRREDQQSSNSFYVWITKHSTNSLDWWSIQFANKTRPCEMLLNRG